MVYSNSSDLLGAVLRDVSRSFYLTLRALPTAVRPQIGLAYLLARAADTIVDTEILPRTERLEYLLQFRRLLNEKVESNAQNKWHHLLRPWGTAPTEVLPSFVPQAGLRRVSAHSPPHVGASPTASLESMLFSLSSLADSASSAEPNLQAEKKLLHCLPRCFELFDSLTVEDRMRVAEVVMQLTVGMELDLRRASKDGGLSFLETLDELEDYTYHVAGCVGTFWTRMCIAHLPAFRTWDVDRMSQLGIRFGKALQWTNILRDIPRDLRNGRCYLPAKDLGEVGLVPSDLYHPHAYKELKPLYFRYLDHVLKHYEAAWEYTMAIPKSCPRVRLACIWPIWIGLETLALLRCTDNPLEATQRIRISRWRVYTIMLLSLWCVKSDRRLIAQYQRCGG